MADEPKQIPTDRESTEAAIRKMFRDDVVGNVISSLVTLLFGRQTIIGVLIGLLLAGCVALAFIYAGLEDELELINARLIVLEAK